MADDAGATMQSVSDGGVALSHPERPSRQMLVAPATEAQANTVRPGLFPIGCFKLEDVRFDFDSSLLLSDVRNEMPLLKALLDTHTDKTPAAGPSGKAPPITIFGHTDPEGSDDYNKGLGGRRAAVVYGMLTRRAEIWEDLYSGTGKFAQSIAGDKWGTRAIQIMLNGLPPDPSVQPPPDPLIVDGKIGPKTKDAVKQFQTQKSLSPTGDPGPDTRKALFLAYMDQLCVDSAGKPFQLDPTSGFLGHNSPTTDGKADFQGCGEFNPVMLFSQAALQKYDAEADHAERDQLNRINRRVMVLLFRPGARVNADSWPCPKAREGAGGCRLRFWSDGEKRRKNGEKERWYKDTKDTFACRFYQRISDHSPCEEVVPRNPDRCKMVPINGKLKISAADLAPTGEAPYSWTTDSTNITLVDADTATVTVQAGPEPSFDMGDEVVTLTCGGSPPVIRTANVTVVKVLFSASSKQLYGFDNFDTPQTSADDHVCIKSADHTFVKVDIEGGALGTDFEFVCDDGGICKAGTPAATTSFDLRLDAGAVQEKGQTVLRAKIKCPKEPQIFGRLQVHVYQQRLVKVIVAKIDNPTSSFLRFPTADYAAHAPRANAKLKEAVVQYNITNYNADNSTTKVAFASGSGVMSFDINNNGGADFTAINNAMSGVPADTVRVAIVRDMKSYYYLASATAANATTLTVKDGSTFYKAGDTPLLGSGATQETVTIVSVSGATITCSALTNAHAAGEAMEFPAGGWSSDPILVMEGNASLDPVKWTVIHEVGHRDLGLKLADIEDRSDLMNFLQYRIDYRLRYCPRKKYYPPEAGTGTTENQWELIPRK